MADDHVSAVREGYTFPGPAIELGALVMDGAAVPEAGVRIPLGMLNRHGLVAGATGTGKTVTLQLMAEQLSAHGVPVFAADIKGDLTGIAAEGAPHEKIDERMGEIGQTWKPAGSPVELFSLGGEGNGVPIRATITDFGPTLLAKVLGLNDVQESSLGLVFHYADKAGLPMLDLKDLRAVVSFLVSDEGAPELKDLGGLARSTAGVILRELITFEDQGADRFFGEPELETADLMRTTEDGTGIVSLLELPDLRDRPQVFSTFLMWLLADLFEELPEVGDLDKPKLVFFFDEAHLLFDDASDPFLDAVAQTVRLIRSKGVGVFFVTQTPGDVPAEVLSQLGNRVQHALRAFTPQDAKALKATVSTFPMSPFDLEEVLTSLGTGEAVVTVLSDRGAPTPVAPTRMRAPSSLMAPAPAELVEAAVAGSPLAAKYGEEVDRESAYERLAARVAAETPEDEDDEEDAPVGSGRKKAGRKSGRRRGRKADQSTLEKVAKDPAMRQMARSAAAVIGREIARSIFGNRRRR